MPAISARPIRLILNGKVAGDVRVRNAVLALRREGQAIEVCVTWEAGDAARFAAEALAASVPRIAGGGTLNEVVNGRFAASSAPEIALAVLPLESDRRWGFWPPGSTAARGSSRPRRRAGSGRPPCRAR